MSAAIQPAYYVVWHKPTVKRSRWVKIAARTTHAEAVAVVSGSKLAGDFHIAPLFDVQLAGGLLDAAADAPGACPGTNDVPDDPAATPAAETAS